MNFSISVWNVNGWTNQNKELRIGIIKTLGSDIICLCETHLKNNDQISVPDYIWFGFNRSVAHTKATRGSGGVGILVGKEFITKYAISVTDKCVDGILGLKFHNLENEYIFIVFVCYLPPESSPWGRDSSFFFSHLVSQIYLYSEVENIFILGDFNARIGVTQDIIETVDNIPPRKPLDTGKNAHGEALLDFLKDSNTCVLNGRLNPENDNYTYFTSRGSSVVDYVIVPHVSLSDCVHFEVLPVTDITDNNKLYYLLNTKSKAPDHALLTVNINTSEYKALSNTKYDPHINRNEKMNSRIFYKFNKKDNKFMNNDNWCLEINNLLYDISNIGDIEKLNSMYCTLCDNVVNEMMKYIPNFKLNSNKNVKQRYKKPFWDDELKVLWNDMKLKEKTYRLAAKRKQCRLDYIYKMNNFKTARNLFDRILRLKERKYNRERIYKIDKLCTNIPNQFWKEIKALGPYKQKAIPLLVRIDEKIIGTLETVKTKWQSDFEKLNGGPTGNVEFDDIFYNEVCKRTLIRSTWMKTEHYESNEYLNRDISFSEMEHVIKQLKLKKSPGIDNIPNEVIKDRGFTLILFQIFRHCFNTGLIPSDWGRAIVAPIPKGRDKDPYSPMSYRGISLLSCIGKAFTAFLNNRIIRYCEMLNLIHDEQNGFRSGRSCVDHLFSLCSIVRNRINQSKNTFVAFIDMEKAFDWTNRNLVFYRLLEFNIDGKMFN